VRFLTENLGLKFGSLFMAALLWVGLSISTENTASITAPVQYTNIPRSLEIGSDIVEEVHLLVRGPSRRLSRFREDRTPLIIDLSKVRTPGETTFTISRDNANLPAGVTLERAIPGQIRIRMERQVTRELPIAAKFAHLPPGMAVKSVQIVPPSLTVFGPQSHIEKLQQLETDPVDLRSIGAEGEVQSTAFANDPMVHFSSAPSLRVRVQLAPASPNPTK
jgi:YbbR domain-containing protein